jgi:serine phosphatase RsbU (regulator of sigma subunit)
VGWVIDCAIAKTNKHASRESGDTAEIVERPGGGISMIAIDGQGSGKAAKTLSLLLSARAVSLIKDGVRDGAVARAVHDHLFVFRNGQVSATIDILSVDLRSRTALVTRNASTPLIIGRGDQFQVAPCQADPLGTFPLNRPAVWELPLEDGLILIAGTDGVATSGRRVGGSEYDLAEAVSRLRRPSGSMAELADGLLVEAIERDQGRPADDMTVLVLGVASSEHGAPVRRMTATIGQA